MSPHLLQPPLHPLPLHLPRGSGHIRCSPISTRIGGRPIPPSHWRPSFTIAATAWSGVEEGPPPEVPVENNDDDDDAPTSIDLVPVVNEEQFDRIIAEAQQLDESVVVLWMANWCRKCIYLKPKLEKLAADYYPRIRFYRIDVNTVPQRLVNRAGITKMPTIQVWRDSQKQAEVIGGHKAWLVIDDVRRIIETED